MNSDIVEWNAGKIATLCMDQQNSQGMPLCKHGSVVVIGDEIATQRVPLWKRDILWLQQVR